MYITGATGLDTMANLLKSGDLSSLESLLVIDIPKSDLSWVRYCTNLSWIVIDSASSTQVDFSGLNKLKRIELNAKSAPSVEGMEQLSTVEEIKLRSPSELDLARLGGRAQRLRIYGPPAKIPKLDICHELSGLWLQSSRKQRISVEGVANLSNLQELYFFSLSKGVDDCFALDRLSKLEKFQLDNVASVDDIGWMLRLPRLKDLYVSKPLPFSEDDHDRLIHHGLIYR